MKVLIAWSSLSGYAAACWKALAARPGVDLRIVAFAPTDRSAKTSAFADDLVRGLDATLVDPADHTAMDAALRRHEDAAVAAVTGWIHPSFVRLAIRRRAAHRPTVMTLDLPWEASLKQWLMCVYRRRHVKGMARIITASAASEHYAVKLGATSAALERGLYAFDDAKFGAIADARLAGDASTAAWPRRFVYVGRYIPEKALEVLAAAYARYRDGVNDPWPLVCCGRGPEEHRLAGVEGIEIRGFVGRHELPGVLADSGAFVLPSRYEPWGVALAEAMGTGLPAICSTACHGGRDLVRDFDTGLTFKNENAASLAAALRWMHEHHDELPTMGRRAAAVAASFTDEVWAKRWHAIFASILAEKNYRV